MESTKSTIKFLTFMPLLSFVIGSITLFSSFKLPISITICEKSIEMKFCAKKNNKGKHIRVSLDENRWKLMACTKTNERACVCVWVIHIANDLQINRLMKMKTQHFFEISFFFPSFCVVETEQIVFVWLSSSQWMFYESKKSTLAYELKWARVV